MTPNNFWLSLLLFVNFSKIFSVSKYTEMKNLGMYLLIFEIIKTEKKGSDLSNGKV